jgi:hypothetical protein
VRWVALLLLLGWANLRPEAPVVEDFDRALALVLTYEGGYVNNPADPGGATNFGITQWTYDSYRTSQSLPRQSVKLITPDEVSAIYKQRYWNALDCDHIPAPLCFVGMDAAVNHGTARARKFLAQSTDPLEVIRLREAFYERLIAAKPALGVFRKGWMNRMKSLRKVVMDAA